MDPDERYLRDVSIIEWLMERYGRHRLVMALAERGRQLRERPEMMNEPRMSGLLRRGMLELASGAIRVEDPEEDE